ncbi:ficolin-1-like [Drosophila innubila]|uniref:ficolin-1-like n=1 Tax=Drosophila innubila TaxID=198719 RepID=UPI00148E8DE6|nr:ficolin-1-like [Drosophila innubila]
MSMHSKLSELSSEISKFSQTNQLLRAELDRQKKVEDNKETEFLRADVEFLRGTIQFIKAELERQRKYGDDKESELKQQKKIIENKELETQSLRVDNQYLRTELEKLKNEGVDKDSKIRQLKAEMEQQKQCKVDNQSLRSEVERQKKVMDALIYPYNCAEVKSNGINEILIPKFSNQSFKVACDLETRGGGWTVILRRMDGSVNFYRNWTEYKNGFGNLDGEFFLGLDKIHALTADRKQELLVILEDFEGDKRLESYDDFAIGNEDQQYVLHTLGKANGTAGDSLDYHRGMKFSTADRDNDEKSNVDCAKVSTGAWWYRNCQNSNLAGKYNDNTNHKGVIWYHFRGHEYSLKTAVMLIRPRK